MAGDPCSLLFGSMKQACENTRTLAGGGSSSGSGDTSSGGSGLLGGLLPNITGDLRHLMLRVAEVGIGIGLVLIAGSALIKSSSTANNAVKTVKKAVK